MEYALGLRIGNSHARPPYIASVCLSRSVLAYEVLLTGRSASSLASLLHDISADAGYGERHVDAAEGKNYPGISALYNVMSAAACCADAAAFLLAQLVRFNPLELCLDSTQPSNCSSLSADDAAFFCGGLGIGLVFSHFGNRHPHLRLRHLVRGGSPRYWRVFFVSTRGLSGSRIGAVAAPDRRSELKVRHGHVRRSRRVRECRIALLPKRQLS